MISSWKYSIIFFITVTSITASDYGSSVKANGDSLNDLDSDQDLRVVSREEWLAQPSVGPIQNLTLPVKYVIISHTATDFCHTQSACTKKVQLLQTYHIESQHWSDIGYNFLVGGDGLAYVGRGWDYEGAHTLTYNNISIGISFIGAFNDVEPTKAQLEAAQKLIELGVKLGKISENYVLLGHRQVAQTLSPGDALYSIIQTWSHWSAVVSAPTESIITIPNTKTNIVEDVELAS